MTSHPTPIEQDNRQRRSHRAASDDIDREIYRLRLVEHMSLRAVGERVGLGKDAVAERLRKMLQDIGHPEVEEMRAQEGHRLDELSHQQMQLAEQALSPLKGEDGQIIGYPSNGLDTAHKCLKEVHALVRTRELLFGLARPVGQAPPDDEQLDKLFETFLAGVRHAEAHQTDG